MIVSLVKAIAAILFTAIMSALELLMIPFFRGGKVFHALAKVDARGALAICGVKVVVEGLDKIDFSRSYIYVANHASFFDIPAVIAGIPDQIRIVYKKELEKIPIFGWALKYGKTYIGIDRGGSQEALQSLEDAANKIRNGASILLFAEGTRTEDGKLQAFKRGAFNLAVKADIPVVPITINGSYCILPKHSLRIAPGTITLVVGKPIMPPRANGKEAEFQLRDEVHRIIREYYVEQ